MIFGADRTRPCFRSAAGWLEKKGIIAEKGSKIGRQFATPRVPKATIIGPLGSGTDAEAAGHGGL